MNKLSATLFSGILISSGFAFAEPGVENVAPANESTSEASHTKIKNPKNYGTPENLHNFIKAIEAKDLEKVKKLVSEYPGLVNAHTQKQGSVLEFAETKGDNDIVKFIKEEIEKLKKSDVK